MSAIEIYKSGDDQIEIQVHFDSDTVWLTQKQMTLLFDQTKQNVSLLINNCFKEGELEKISTVKESLTVQQEDEKNVSCQGFLDNLTRKCKKCQYVRISYILPKTAKTIKLFSITST